MKRAGKVTKAAPHTKANVVGMKMIGSNIPTICNNLLAM